MLSDLPERPPESIDVLACIGPDSWYIQPDEGGRVMFTWTEDDEGGTCHLGNVLVGGYVNWGECQFQCQFRHGIPARRWFFGKDPIQATAYFETDTKHIDLGSAWLHTSVAARRWIERRVEAFLSQKDAA